MTIAIEILTLGVLLLLFYAQWKGKPVGKLLGIKRRRKKKGPDAHRAEEMERVASQALQELHCDVSWETENAVRIGQFDFQNGHFQLRIDPSSAYASLAYLFCFNVKLDQLNPVRIVVNKCNINSENHRIIYTINDERNEVDLHILAGIRLSQENARETLTECMTGAFAWQNTLARHLAERKDGQGKADTELSNAERGRELFLLHEHEMRMQGDDGLRKNEVDRVTLGQFLEKTLGLTGLSATRLEFANPEYETLEDSDEILDYDLSQALFANGKRVASQTVAMLRVIMPDMPLEERLITLTFNEEGSDGLTDYFRVSAYLVPLSVSTSHPFNQKHHIQLNNSALMAYDHVSRQQQREESNYMWKEAVQKKKNGQADELTDEQKLLSNCSDAGLAHLLYRGRKLYLAGRYYEALLLFENAFIEMTDFYDRMDDNELQSFYDLVFDIGFCYSELKVYDKALFYLEMLSGLHRITYTMEYVNCLVNSGDYRAQQAIDHLIAGVKMNLEEDEQPQEHIAAFLAFLQRRKVYVLIEKQAYNKAQRMLKKMLNDPENADFALNELAYLQKKLGIRN